MLDQLAGKKRTYEDLSRFVGARTSGNANYSLLLGAGCSVSSNVRSASQLVEVWRREVFGRLCPKDIYSVDVATDFLAKNHAVWYNPQREYSSLFEKNFDLPRQRRMFVEQEVSGKNPNLGYAYLVRLIEEGFLNTVFTTNFDDLVNESFFQFSQQRPIVCAHDSSIGSISVTAKRPKIIKLHGDYLFDDIKSTVRETESLEDNTRKKFIEFFRDFGLIVVGYGGYDRSIMDVLQYLLRSEDYFKHGVYWCIRKGDEPSDELLKLLWRDRVYFVEIDGFDELMASLHSDLIGATLPIDTGVVTNKPRSIIKGFCENLFLNDSPSEIIKKDLERLRRQSDREDLFNFLRDTKDGPSDKENFSADELSERELLVLLEVKRHMHSGDYDLARELISSELSKKLSHSLKEELSELRIKVEEMAGDMSQAVAAVDSLIAEDSQESESYLRKTFLVFDHAQRLSILKVAESVDSENYKVYVRRMACNIEAYNAGIGKCAQEIVDAIDEDFALAVKYEPGLRNPAWSMVSSFYSQCVLPKDQIRNKLDEIVEASSAMGVFRTISLRVRLSRWSRFKEDRNSAQADELLKNISDARLSSSKHLKPYYEWLELDAYRKLDRKEELSRRLSELALIPDLCNTQDYWTRKSDFLIQFNGDINGAIAALKDGLVFERNRSDIHRMASLMELANDYHGIAELLSKYSGNLNAIDKMTLKRLECLAKGDRDSALVQLRAMQNKKISSASFKLEEIHDLMVLTRYPEASVLAEEFLRGVDWNKLNFGEHIVNFEIAQTKIGNAINKKRLGELLSITMSESVKICAYYLLGDYSKAKDIVISQVREDKVHKYLFLKWAIFKDEKGQNFLSEAIKLAL